jgi:5-methylcytosine-specific restriction endonuclease McrA
MPFTSTGQRIRRRKALLKRDGPLCRECGVKDPLNGETLTEEGHSWLTIDHIVPTRRGGTNDLSNLRLICTTCHREQDDMRPGGIYPDGERDPYADKNDFHPNDIQNRRTRLKKAIQRMRGR